MIQIKDNKVISTDNKIIHIIGTDTYGKSFFPARYPLEKYEEVDEIPIIPSRAEYEQKVEYSNEKAKDVSFAFSSVIPGIGSKFQYDYQE